MYRNENVFIMIYRTRWSLSAFAFWRHCVNALSRDTFVLLHKPLNITDRNYLNICIEFTRYYY